MAGLQGRSAADQLAALGRDLFEQGEAGKGLRKEVAKGIMRATRPVKEDLVRAARDDLPHSGGLNDWVADNMKVVTRLALRGRNVGVRIVMSLDKGHIIKDREKARDEAKTRRREKARQRREEQRRLNPPKPRKPPMSKEERQRRARERAAQRRADREHDDYVRQREDAEGY